MSDIHLIKKDFKIEWFSGTGKGGQHRNKHQNCCRIIHTQSGLKAQGTESRSRVQNQRLAFTRLVSLILAYDLKPAVRRSDGEVIRNYNEVRNEVHDKASGAKSTYTSVVKKGNIGEMVEARKRAMEEL